MLKYRQYLEQSRAHRGQRQFSAHFQSQGVSGQQIKSHQNIKDFVSQPGYGQIFYSQEHKKGQPENQHLKSSLKTQKSKNDQMKHYMTQLEEQNKMLKLKIQQIMKNNIQQQQQYSDQNIQSNHNIQLQQNSPHYIPLNSSAQNHKPQVIAHHVPQNFVHHAAQPSFNVQGAGNFYEQNQPRFAEGNNQVYQQPAFLPPTSENLKYNKPMNSSNSGHHHFPSFPHNVQQETNQTQFMAAPTFDTRQSFPVISSPIIPPSQSLIYNSSHHNAGNNEYKTKSSQSSLFTLAKQRLNQIKDDDEQLRAYTIQLLKKY